MGKKNGTWHKVRTAVRTGREQAMEISGHKLLSRRQAEGQSWYRVSYTRKEGEPAEVRRDLMPLKDYRNI